MSIMITGDAKIKILTQKSLNPLELRTLQLTEDWEALFTKREG